MHGLREEGWTLIELMTILAVVGVMSTMAFASLKNYNRKEDARSAARSVAGALETARSEALTTGRMTWLVFKQPVNGVAPFAANQFAALIYDTNNDLQADAADTVRPITLPPGPRSHAFLYDPAVAPYSATVLPDLDRSMDIPDGTLADVVSGTTLNVDAFLGVPVVGFSSQGFPVKAGTVLAPGSGAGAVYMSDNDSSVMAIVLMPAGEVRTLAYDAGSNEWK